MKNKIKYLFLSFICFVFVANAQQIHETDKSPVYQTEGSAMATSSVDGEELLKRSGIDPANTLYGRLNGLTVLQNSSYGDLGEGSPFLFIRGLGTLNDPSILVLVDGMERPINSLVTEEIENVTILKDAAALALYGMRGANGVLLVTTKRGKEGKTDINVAYQHSLTTPARLPKFANAPAYATAVNEGLANEGLAPQYSAREIEAYRNRNYPYLFPDVNWMDETLRDWGQRDQVNFSARGGSNNARFFSLINIISDRGLIKEANLNPAYTTQLMGSALNARTNIDVNLTPSTLMQASLLGRITERNEPGSLSPTAMMTDLYNLPSAAYPVYNQSGTWGGGSDIYPLNPVAQSSSTGYSTYHYRGMFVDLLLKQDLSQFVQGLNIEGKVAFDAGATSTDVRSKRFLSESVVAQLNDNGAPGPPVITQYGQDEMELGFTGGATDVHRFFRLEFRLNYNKEIGSGNLSSFLLFSQDKKTVPVQFSTVLHQDVTAFGHYSLLDRYYFDLSLSASGSSNLPKNNNWGFFPAVAAAWRISKEDFFNQSDWLDELKLRASFGLAGNDKIIYNLDQYPFEGGNNYYFRDNYTSFASRMEGHLPGRRVSYEKTQMFNVGIESQLFQKIAFNVDVFSNKTYDIMVSKEGTISSMLGVIPSYIPDGEVKNKGVELGLRIGDQTGDFKYAIGGQFSFVRNKIVNMNEAPLPHDYMKATGRPVEQFFGLETIGFFKDQADINQSPKQLFYTVYPGDLKYKDQNGDGQIDQNDVIALGYSTLVPEIYYSATLDLEYKGIGISALFQGIGNYSRYLNTQGLYWPLMGNGNISEHYLDSYWKPGAANTDVKYPRLTTLESRNNYRPNSVFIADASYFKLRYAELFYKLPISLISKFKLDGCKVFVRGMDLFSIDQIKVTDPEATGADYPALKSYHLGFSINF